MAKDLKFQLLLEAETGQFVKATKQSEDSVKAMFEQIKQQSQQVGNQFEHATKEAFDFAKAVASIRTNQQGLDDIKNLISIVKEAGGTVGQLESRYEQLAKSFNTLSTHEQSQQVRRLREALSQLGATTEEAVRNSQKLDDGLKVVSKTSHQSKINLGGLKVGITALASAMAALGVGLSANEFLQTADSYTNLSTKIKIATQETGNFEQAMVGVQQVALATNTNLQDTAQLFSRMNTVAKDLGYSTQQTLDLTKTVNLALQMGGGSAEESAAAVLQFSQAMGAGVLRGEEFNSIMENGFPLAQALAKGLGVTVGELRKMAEAGELSSQRVMNALMSQKESIEKTYNSMPTTIANAIQKVKTQWEILIGEFDQANGGSAGIAKFISGMADSLGFLKKVLNDVSNGFSWVSEKIENIDPSLIFALKSAVGEAYEIVKNLAVQFADMGSTVVTTMEDAINLALLPFGSALNGSAKEVSAFEKALNLVRLAVASLSDGVSAINIAFKFLLAGVETVGAGFLRLQASIVEIFSANMAKNITQMSDKLIENARKNFAEAGKLTDNFKSQTQAVWDDMNKTQEQRQAEQLEVAKKTMNELLAVQKTEKDGKVASEKEKLQAVQDYVTKAVEANKGILDSTLQQDLASKGYIVTLNEQGNVAVETAEKVQQAQKSTQKLLDDARKSASALGVDLDVSFNRVSEKFKANLQHVENMVAGIEQLGAKGEQVGHTLFTAWSKWLESAKSQSEIDMAKQKLDEFREKGVFSAKQVELGMKAIQDTTKKISPELDAVGQAFERLGIKTKEQLKLSAQANLADFELVRKSGKATTESLQQAYEQVLKTAQASGDQALIAQAKAKGASLGLGNAIEQTADRAVQSFDRMTASAQRFKDTVEEPNMDENTWEGAKNAREKRMSEEDKAKFIQAVEKQNALSNRFPAIEHTTLANVAANVVDVEPKKQVQYKLEIGGASVELYGDSRQEMGLNALFDQLEMLKKRS